MTSKSDNVPTAGLPIDRDTLGRMVRESWIRWAKEQPAPKPSWLVPYDDLSEADKEADRRIGEDIAKWTMIHTDARATLSPAPAGEPVAWQWRRRQGPNGEWSDWVYDRAGAQPAGWRPIESAPKDGTRFLAWSEDDQWPVVVYWQSYDEATAEELGEAGYWAFAENLLSDVCGQAEFEYWQPFAAPSTEEPGQ